METEVSSIESSHKSKQNLNHSLSKSSHTGSNSNSNSDFEEKNLNDSKISKKNSLNFAINDEKSTQPVKRVTLYADKVCFLFIYMSNFWRIT